MYKVTIKQSYKDVSLEYECRDDAFALIDKVFEGDSNVKIEIEITEGGESNDI